MSFSLYYITFDQGLFKQPSSDQQSRLKFIICTAKCSWKSAYWNNPLPWFTYKPITWQCWYTNKATTVIICNSCWQNELECAQADYYFDDLWHVTLSIVNDLKECFSNSWAEKENAALDDLIYFLGCTICCCLLCNCLKMNSELFEPLQIGWVLQNWDIQIANNLLMASDSADVFNLIFLCSHCLVLYHLDGVFDVIRSSSDWFKCYFADFTVCLLKGLWWLRWH